MYFIGLSCLLLKKKNNKQTKKHSCRISYHKGKPVCLLSPGLLPSHIFSVVNESGTLSLASTGEKQHSELSQHTAMRKKKEAIYSQRIWSLQYSNEFMEMLQPRTGLHGYVTFSADHRRTQKCVVQEPERKGQGRQTKQEQEKERKSSH